MRSQGGDDVAGVAGDDELLVGGDDPQLDAAGVGGDAVVAAAPGVGRFVDLAAQIAQVLQMPARVVGAFSPTPAVKMMASTPFMAAT